MLSKKDLQRKKKLEYAAEYRRKNSEKIKEYAKTWREANPEYHSKHRKSGYINPWDVKNRKEYKREYEKRRRASDPAYRAISNARTRIGKFMKKKYKSSKSIGCSFQEFKSHIQSKFKPGMSWDNYGEWHIDHIYPLSLAINEPESFKKACHYTNLQPLWASENVAKGNKHE